MIRTIRYFAALMLAFAAAAHAAVVEIATNGVTFGGTGTQDDSGDSGSIVSKVYGPRFFQDNVYLHDDTNTPLHLRLNGSGADISDLKQATNNLNERLDNLWVVNKGGWHYPDYFFASARPGGEAVETETISTNTTVNAIETLRANETVRGWVLSVEIERQSEWGSAVEWELGEDCDGLWSLSGDMVVPDGATVEDVAVGDVFTATGRMGDFERAVEMTVTSDNVSTSGKWQWDGWVDGGLVDTAAFAQRFADESPSASASLRTWPQGYGSWSNYVTAGWNTNFWIFANDEYPALKSFFSCVSYHTDGRKENYAAYGVYHPVTMVTPRHGIVANHWKPIVGSNVYWVGNSGAIYTNKVVEYKNVRGDLTVARLDHALPINDFTFPYLLFGDYELWFYGCEHGGAGCPGVAAVSFDCAERAYLTYWQCSAAMYAKRAKDKNLFTVKARGSGTVHGRKQAAVGGDSGSPTFLFSWDQDEGVFLPILLGCFHWSTVNGGTAGGPIPLAEEVNSVIAEWGDEEQAKEVDFNAWGYEPHRGMTPW